MPVKRRSAKARNEGVSDVAWALLNDAPVAQWVRGSAADIEQYVLECVSGPETAGGSPTLEGLWPIHGTGIVEAWAVEHPGTRPSLWWCQDAPRTQHALAYPQAWNRSEEGTEPRLRVGGIGTPGLSARYRLGVPTDWIKPWEADYYNGRLVSVRGEPIGTEYTEGHFEGVPPDPLDPPRFESQATYLVRHGLLLPGERARLKAAAFKPETIDAQGFLDEIARRDEEDRQERIKAGTWQGEPEGWTGRVGAQ